MNILPVRNALLLALACALAVPLAATAEQSRKFGNVEVHYNAISSTELTPEIARGYGIARSPQQGIVTVSVLAPNAAGAKVPVRASIQASAVNPNEQRSDLKFREITEKDAVYYLADFSKTLRDTIKFTLVIKVADQPKPETLEFTKEFFD